MLTLKQIQDNPQEVIERLKIKNYNVEELVNNILDKDNTRRSIQQQLDSGLSEMNTISKSIGMLFKEGKVEEANAQKKKTAEIKERNNELNDKLSAAANELQELLVQLPNIPHDSVPAGKSDADNVVIRDSGEFAALEGDVLPHWDLVKRHDIIDFELGTKLTGAGFPVYKGKGARLQRALISFFLDEAQKAGYTEVMPPLMVNEDSGFGTGQLPDKEGQMYHITEDNLYLIPTAEVPVTNIFRDVILDGKDLPVKYTAYTPCFRREAGSYGKDVRGLNRLHQFDKVEIVQVSHPDKSYETLDSMVEYVEGMIQKLDLPYRVLRLCGGDLSFTSALTFDFEVYSKAQEKWLEVSSVSNFETYQANRLKLRFREEGSKKPVLAHTLNGSALALPRILAAILENYQTDKGIKVPDALVGYTGFEYID
ncbi:MAG: serine--tRNA ligase [Bacteroidales bacterium]|jgi:seryl-tRNA synthetase|nr:serine--tRNA ligase [Bacteroidales bacterium]